MLAKKTNSCRHDAYYPVGCMPEADRAIVVEAMDNDPLRYGWEPPIWWVVDALIDFPYCTSYTEKTIRKNTGLEWEAFKAAMRQALKPGLKKVDSVLATGMNRSSKSQYAAKRGMMMAEKNPAVLVMGCHTQKTRSREDQQVLFWRHFPKDWKKTLRTETTWISYTRAGGFRPDDAAVLPNGTLLKFATYSQDLRSMLEGKIPKYCNLDEAFTLDWLKTLEMRSAQVNGVVVGTYTPVDGWTEGVGAFMDDMVVVKSMPAFLLPRDGKAVLPWMALGLKEDEYRELEQAEVDKRDATAMQCRPQNCLAWLDGKDGMPEIPKDRLFQSVPRVALSKGDRRAVVWFHPCDNPWGNPKEVVRKAGAFGDEGYKKYIYAIIQKKVGLQFPMFGARHIISANQVPAGGTAFHLCDPAERNWFMLWVKVVGKKAYVYREWPGNYHVPGHGIPEEWATPSTGRTRKMDGEKGAGQDTFGFDLVRYKFEWARTEGWADWKNWVAMNSPDEDDVAPTEQILAWNPENSCGAFVTNERIVERVVDGRPAVANGRTGIGEVRTLLDDMNDNIGMDNIWNSSTTNQVRDGVERIVAALNSGTLYVSEECKNLIFSFKHWTGHDGRGGACKDPLDCLRWFFDMGFIDKEVPRGTEEKRETYDAIRNRENGFIGTRYSQPEADDDDSCVWEN